MTAVAVLAAGAVPTAAGAGGSAWPTLNGDPQHSRQGIAVGPVTPRVTWTWQDPTYVADGSLGGTVTNLPAVLDGSGRLLFKSRHTGFDGEDGQSARYDLLALDPETGDATVVLPDVQRGFCAPAIGADGTIWTYQAINERTAALGHHPESDSWIVGIDPASDTVVHRYSGEGVHSETESAIGNCLGSMNIGPDGTVLVLGHRNDSSPGGSNDWLRALHPDGTSKWEVNLVEVFGDDWVPNTATDWQLVALDASPGAGTLYLGHQQESDGVRNPALSAFDLNTGALRDTIALPGTDFVADAVVDPGGGIVVSTDEVSDPDLGHLVRVTDDGTSLALGWRQDIAADDGRTGALQSVPRSLQVSGDRVVGWSHRSDNLVSFDWADGRFRWSTPVGFRSTSQVVVDAAGNIYAARLVSEGDPQLEVYSPSGRLIGFLGGSKVTDIRTLGPLAADGTLYVWGADHTWAALDHDPHGIVPCPAGTSESVTCRRAPSGGYRMRGTGAGETFVGSGDADIAVGRGGPDVIRTRGGRDRLAGGAGEDTLVGGGGRDTYLAGSGRDRVNARGQRGERVDCGGGRDLVTRARGDRVADNCESVRR